MSFKKVSQQLSVLLRDNLSGEGHQWLTSKLDLIIKEESVRELYLAYSLIPSKIINGPLCLETADPELKAYLELQGATVQQLARIFMLIRVLEENPEFFRSKVANLIQIADTGELETFLKFLIFLPHPEDYKFQAVEALRTNIATIFNAIALNNPYPALYFNDQQWNQMYLKAAFMQQNLLNIQGVDERANADLARIVSDYAHERWAASRTIDPYFWRPVSPYLETGLLKDMERLFQSENILERRAASLCCAASGSPAAKDLLDTYPEFVSAIESGTLKWETLG